MSGSVVTAGTNILPQSNEIIRLLDFGGRDGILRGIHPLDDGWLLADLDGILVELPASLEEELRPLMGKPIRANRLLGKYRVTGWAQKVPA